MRTGTAFFKGLSQLDLRVAGCIKIKLPHAAVVLIQKHDLCSSHGEQKQEEKKKELLRGTLCLPL